MKIFTVEDLSETFRISTSTVRLHCQRNEWPHVRFGRTIRFTEHQVAAIVEAHAVEVAQVGQVSGTGHLLPR